MAIRPPTHPKHPIPPEERQMPLTPTPHLEDEIDTLRLLDDRRNRVYTLRDSGVRAISRAHSIASGGGSSKNSLDRALAELWCHPTGEPDDFIQPSLQYILASSRIPMSLSSVEDELKGLLETTKTKLLSLSIHDLFDWPSTHAPRRLDGVHLPDHRDPSQVAPPNHSRVEIFQAARVFQALLQTPDTVFSKPSMLCYYRILRELYSIDAPNWMVGGARATRGGYPSAFMTGECTRGLNRFARLITDTAKFLALMRDRRRQLYQTLNNRDGIELWSYVEMKRQAISLYNAVKNESRNVFLQVPFEQLTNLVQAANQDPITSGVTDEEWATSVGAALDSFISHIGIAFQRAADLAVSQIRIAKEEITRFHSIEHVHLQNEGNSDAELRIGLAHATGFRAIEGAFDLAKKGLAAGEAFISWSQIPPGDKQAICHERILDDWLESLREASDRVKKIFTPAKVFVESVLDREIERGKTRKAHLGELIFSAATYVSIEQRENDTRVQNAMDVILQELTSDGQLTHPGHLDTDSHGYSLLLVLSEVHRALALLIDRSDAELSVDAVDKILQYFERTAVRFPEGGELCGWSHDFPRHPKCSYSWTTALCILALDRLGRTLDNKLNRRVARHFACRIPIPGQNAPLSLSQLVYPDYGLAAMGEKVLANDYSGPSVAVYMERMPGQSHVQVA
jgi:hypothetical protein